MPRKKFPSPDLGPEPVPITTWLDDEKPTKQPVWHEPPKPAQKTRRSKTRAPVGKTSVNFWLEDDLIALMEEYMAKHKIWTRTEMVRHIIIWALSQPPPEGLGLKVITQADATKSVKRLYDQEEDED